MRNLKDIILEKLVISKDKLQQFTEHPKTNDDLRKLVKYAMTINGNNCDLNHIDVSKIKDFSMIFKNLDFDGDISNWDVSKVTVFNGIFGRCYKLETIRLTNWNLASATEAKDIFYNCNSLVNVDISNWVLNLPTSGVFSGTSKLRYIKCNDIPTLNILAPLLSTKTSDAFGIILCKQDDLSSIDVLVFFIKA